MADGIDNNGYSDDYEDTNGSGDPTPGEPGVSMTIGQEGPIPGTGNDGIDNDGDSDDWADTTLPLGKSPGDSGVNMAGQVFADGIDNDGDGLTDEGIDEGIIEADGVDNDGDGEAESPRDALGRAMADGIDNDEDGLIDEGIDENIDEGINEDLGDNAFNAMTTRRNPFGTYDNFLGDIDSVILYKDDGDGQFDPVFDTPISRHDPEQVDWYWERINPPVMTMVIVVDPTFNEGRGAPVPVTDDGTYDFFVVITMDGDDRGDYFQPGAREPNPSDVETGIIMLDYEGVRPGDDFMISLARGSTPLHGGGIGTDAGYPNAAEVTKPIEGKMYVDDIIGYVPDTVQGDEGLGFQVDRPERVPQFTDDDVFVGNPYMDATSSPIGVIGIDVADNPYQDPDEQDFIDSVTVKIRALSHDEMTRSVTFEGTFDINVAGSVVSVPDLMPLADDSTGGVGLYRDNPDSGIPGGFDSQDIPIELRNDFLQYKLVEGTTDVVEVTLRPTDGLTIPPEDFSADTRGHDYYVVIRTSETIDYRDVFDVTVPDGGVLFRSGPSVQNSGVTTDSIATNVPVFSRSLTLSDPETIIANIPDDVSGVAAVGLNMYDRVGADSGLPTNMQYILVNFANVGGDNQFTIEDLAPIGTGPNNTILKTDGVAVYRDTLRTDARDGYEPIPGVFDETDQLVKAVPLIGNIDGFPNSVFLFLDPFGDDPTGGYQDAVGNTDAADDVIGERIPPNDLGPYEGDDYFVVIRPDSDISNGDDFIVQVRPLVNNDVVEWPIHYLPDRNKPTTFVRSADAGGPVTDTILQEVNKEFRLNYSYEAVETDPFLANTQTDTVFSDLTEINETIEAKSNPKAVIGINMNDQGAVSRNIARIDFEITSPIVAGPNVPSVTVADFNPFSPTPNSGFALYADNNDAGVQGEFDPFDTFLQLVPSGSSAVQNGDVIDVEITFSPGVPIPDDDLGENDGPDFFIVVRTSDKISFLDQFQVTVRENGIVFESGPSFGNSETTSNLITTNVPVFPTDTTGFFGASFNRNNGPDDVIGLNFITGTKASPNTSNEKLVSLVVELNKVGDSAFTNSDIAPLSAIAADSGIALYLDDGSIHGRFDPDDTPLNLANSPFYAGENEVFMRLATPEVLPPRDLFTGSYFGPDLFIVLRTSGSITQDSVFNVTVRNIRFERSITELVFSTGPIDGGKVNEPPFLELVNPEVGDATNTIFTLRWEDFDPDSNADIRFFFVSDQDYLANGSTFFGLASTPLSASDSITQAQGIKEDPDGDADTFPWDVSLIDTSKFEPAEPRVAELRVGGTITDGIANYTSASPSFLTVTNDQPTLDFTAFSGDGVIPGTPPSVLEGVPFNIGFAATDPEGRGSVDVFFVDETATAAMNTPEAQALFAGTSRIAPASLDALSPGNVYRVNDAIISVTQSTTRSIEVTGGNGGLSDQMISGSPRTFVALAHIRDIVAGSREFDTASAEFARITITPNAPPTFAFTGALAGGGTAFETDGDDRFEITWVDSEPNAGSDARITLYFQNTNGGVQRIVSGFSPGSATPVVNASGIAQIDTNDYFTWVLSGLNSGTYKVRGVIEDEISKAEDQAFVVLNRPSSFSFISPTVDLSLYTGQDLTIEWVDSNPDFDDDEQLRFFLENEATSSETSLNSSPIPVSNDTDRLVVETADLDPGTYNLLVTLSPPPPNSAGLSRTLYALKADNSMVRITIIQNDPPVLVFDPLDLAEVVAANPSLPSPTRGGVVSDGNAAIPIVWTDSNDNPQTAVIDLYFATDVANASTYGAVQGEYPPTPGIVGNRVQLVTDNGPGTYPGHGAFTIGATQDVFFWDINDPDQVPRGVYRIVATVTEEYNQPVLVTSPNTIKINRRPTIQFTTTLPAQVARGDDLTLTFNAVDTDSNASIRLFYRLDRNLDNVPDTPLTLAPIQIPGSTETVQVFSEDLFEDGAITGVIFPTELISPVPDGNFGLFFTIEIKDEDNSDSDTIPSPGGVIITPNQPPSLVLMRPNIEIDQEDTDTGFVHVYPDHLIRSGTDPALVKIEWVNGTDDNAGTTFALYFDNNRFGADGTPIEQVDINGFDSTSISLDVNPAGMFFWDVTQGMPAGDWYIYALMDDGVNDPVAIYSDGFIRVNQPPEFEFLEPDGFDDYLFRGESYTIAWSDNDPDSNAIINLFLDIDNDLSNGFGPNIADLNGGTLGLNISEDDETDRQAVNTALLVAGSYTVVAHVDDGVNRPFLFQSDHQVQIRATSGTPQITITQPSGGSPTDPLVITTPTMLITWIDDPVSDSRRDQSFIQLFWDTDFFGNDGNFVIGDDVAFDGSIISATRVPVELEPTEPPSLPESLRDQDQIRVSVDQFPKGEVLYLYAKITDTGVLDASGEIVDGLVSSEVYASNAFVINASPDFRWIVPGPGEPADIFRPVNPRGNPLPVTFVANDPDSVALIDLFLDEDTDSSTGLIEVRDPGQNIRENDGVSTVVLNLADEVDEASVATMDRTYYLLAKVTDGVTVTEYYSAPFTVTANEVPALSVITPSTDVVVPATGEFLIEWLDDDPDSNAEITVFLDFDMLGCGGPVIPGTYETEFGLFLPGYGIPEDNDNGRLWNGQRLDQFTWDLSKTDPGTYYVGVRAEDGANEVCAFSPGRVIVNSPPLFAWINPPPQGAFVVQGNSFDLQWEDSDDDAATLITLYLDTDNIDFNGNEIAVPAGTVLLQDDADNLSFNTGIINIPSGQTEIVVTPVAVVTDGVNPPVIVRSEGSITVDYNDPPRITLLEPRRETVLFDNLFTLRWEDWDPDSSALIDFFLDTDDQDADGTPIHSAQDIEEDDETDLLEVDFSDTTPGRYYPYAVIDDGFNRPYVAYAPAPIHILSGTEVVEFAVYLLDSFGVIYPVGDVGTEFEGPMPTIDDIYRNIEVTADGRTLVSLRADGLVEQFGDQKVEINEIVPPPVAGNEYIDIEFTPNERGLVLLDSFGNMVTIGDATPLAPSNAMGLFGTAMAKDLELTRDGNGAFILDCYGGVHAFGNAIQFNEFPFFGYDVARDIELDSQGGYILDGLGGIFPLGRSPDLSPGADFGYDIARDLLLFEKGGFYILDGQGGITAAGTDALVPPSNEPASNPVFPGMDVIEDFAVAGSVEITDEALLAMSMVRRFEVAFRNEDLESLLQTLSLDYADDVYGSRSQLINGTYDDFGNQTSRGVLDEWADTVDLFGGPLAGFYLDNPLVTFSARRQCRQPLSRPHRREGYRGATEELEITVPSDPPMLITYTVDERDSLPDFADASFSAVPTTFWMDDPGDHRGVIMYIDKALPNEFGQFPDPLEWRDEFRYDFHDYDHESFTTSLQGMAIFRMVFTTAMENLSGMFPYDPRPIRIGYISYAELTEVGLTFTVKREGPREWRITSISPITNLVP